MFIHNFFNARAVWFNPLGHKEQATKRHYACAIGVGVISLGVIPAVYGLTHLVGKCCVARRGVNPIIDRIDQQRMQIPGNQAPLNQALNVAVVPPPYPFEGINLTTEEYRQLPANQKIQICNQLKEIKKTELHNVVNLLIQIRFLKGSPFNRLLSGISIKEWAYELKRDPATWQPEAWLQIERNLQLCNPSEWRERGLIYDLWTFCLSLPLYIEELMKIKKELMDDLLIKNNSWNMVDHLHTNTWIILGDVRMQLIGTPTSKHRWAPEDVLPISPLDRTYYKLHSLEALRSEILYQEITKPR